jgi:hypothetical protein
VLLILDAYTESHFLFDADIPEYLRELWDRTNKLVGLRGRTVGVDEDIIELVTYFHAQPEICREKFRKYLSIPSVR